MVYSSQPLKPQKTIIFTILYKRHITQMGETLKIAPSSHRCQQKSPRALTGFGDLWEIAVWEIAGEGGVVLFGHCHLLRFLLAFNSADLY